MLCVLMLMAPLAAGCAHAQAKTSPEMPALDMPSPPSREVEPTEVEAPQPVGLPTEPAHNPPGASAAQPAAAESGATEGGAAQARTAAGRSAEAAGRTAQAADHAADDAGDRRGRRRTRDPVGASACDRRPQPRGLSRLERRRSKPVRHGQTMGPAGRRKYPDQESGVCEKHCGESGHDRSSTGWALADAQLCTGVNILRVT